MDERSNHKTLSKRESQLFDLAANGFTDAAIANRLGISEATVATYWSRIRVKYGPLPRAELVAHILQERHEVQLSAIKQENLNLLTKMHEMMGATNGSAAHGIYEELLNVTGDAYFVIDRNGVIEWVNSSAMELLGYKRNELIGKHIGFLVPEHFQHAHRAHIEGFFNAPRRRVMAEHSTTYAVRADGEPVEIFAVISSLKTSDGEYAVCIARSTDTDLKSKVADAI